MKKVDKVIDNTDKLTAQNLEMAREIESMKKTIIAQEELLR